MVKTPWKSAVVALVLALGLAGCGDDGDDTAAEAPEQTEAPAADERASESESGVVEETAESDGSGEAVSEGDAAEPTAEGGAAADAEEGGLAADGEAPLVPEDEEIDADAETLGESPTETLEEGGALPGEPTRSDIDAIIEETERRFEEAQRRLDEQFEEVESEPSVPEPMNGDSMEFETELEPSGDMPEVSGSELDEQAAQAGEPTRRDIDAIIEEQERRFEEAQRELDEQFEEAERRDPTEGLEELDVPEPTETND
ncbi:putative sodium/potassium/calcium exchanger [Halomonas faecis]|uniref:hypothetical protein n=1 Tax=Halomonas faecis TaxID=1562110 RepID=UPI0013D4B806|nr:hypothetical protein [Halomonas faecis]